MLFSIIVCALLFLVIGSFLGKDKQKKEDAVVITALRKSRSRRETKASEFHEKTSRVIRGHADDINRIREENLLSRSEERFFRLLKLLFVKERVTISLMQVNIIQTNLYGTF